MIVLNDSWLVRCCLNLHSFGVYVYLYILNIFSTTSDPLLLLAFNGFLAVVREVDFLILTYLPLFGSASALTKLSINDRKKILFWTSELNSFSRCLFFYFSRQMFGFHCKLNLFSFCCCCLPMFQSVCW